MSKQREERILRSLHQYAGDEPGESEIAVGLDAEGKQRKFLYFFSNELGCLRVFLRWRKIYRDTPSDVEYNTQLGRWQFCSYFPK